MSHTDTAKKLYASFQKGDVPGILELVMDNVDWNNSGVASKEAPWNENFSTKKNLPGFFKALAENLDFKVFNPTAFIEQGDNVAVQLRLESVVKKNKKSYHTDAVHIWTFDKSGKVSKYRHYNDTAAELAAWRG